MNFKMFQFNSEFIYTREIINSKIQGQLTLQRFRYSGWLANRTLYEKKSWMPDRLAVHSGIVLGVSQNNQVIYILERNDTGVNLRPHYHFSKNDVITLFQPLNITCNDLLKNISKYLESELKMEYNIITNNCHTFTARFTSRYGWLKFTDPLNLICIASALLSVPFLLKTLVDIR